MRTRDDAVHMQGVKAKTDKGLQGFGAVTLFLEILAKGETNLHAPRIIERHVHAAVSDQVSALQFNDAELVRACPG
jgi:hypothetical protein